MSLNVNASCEMSALIQDERVLSLRDPKWSIRGSGCSRKTPSEVKLATYRPHCEWVSPATDFLPQHLLVEQTFVPESVVVHVIVHLAFHLIQGCKAERAVPTRSGQQPVGRSSVMIIDVLTRCDGHNSRAPVPFVLQRVIERVSIILDVEVKLSWVVGT